MGNKISEFLGDIVVGSKESSFPLPKLPPHAVKNVLLTMDFIDLISFSLISNSTKRLVTSVKMRAVLLDINIRDHLLIEVYWFYNMRFDIYLQCAEWIGVRPSIQGDIQIGGFRWKLKKNYELKDWLEHFRTIFSRKYDKILFLPESARFEISTLEDTIGDLSSALVEISSDCDSAHVQEIHRNLHSVEEVLLTANPYEDLVDFQRFLTRNFRGFMFDWAFNPTLEDLLVSNAKILCVKGALSGGIINQFLKLWVKGGNRRMKYLFIYFPVGEHPKMAHILKDIHYKFYGRQRDLIKIDRKSGSSAVLCTRIVEGFVTLMFIVPED